MKNEEYRKANFKANLVIVVVSVAIFITIKKFNKAGHKANW